MRGGWGKRKGKGLDIHFFFCKTQNWYYKRWGGGGEGRGGRKLEEGAVVVVGVLEVRVEVQVAKGLCKNIKKNFFFF